SAVPSPSAGLSGPLPLVATPLTAEQVRERLLTASKRGRLPGFHNGGAAFAVAAHGHPFDGVMSGRWRDGKLVFESRMLRRMPRVFAATLILTVWPGVYLMDQLIPGEWGWIPTWWWYLPITAIPIPWMWRSLMRKSRASIDASAREAIGKIAAEV